MEDKQIVRRWLELASQTVNARKLDAHLDLFSKELEIFGLPGIERLDFEGWAKRRRNDLNNGLLLRTRFDEVRIKLAGDGRITFSVRETLKGTRGEQFLLSKDLTLVQEADEQWRLRKARIREIEQRQLPGLD